MAWSGAPEDWNYTNDPNGIRVEFCTTTRPFGPEEIAEAARLLADPNPEVPPPPTTRVHRANRAGA